MSDAMPPSAHELLRAAILDLFYETLSRFPPPYAPGPEPAGEPPFRLGEYLIYQGYLSRRELRAALQESEEREPGRTIPLGLVLVTRYHVPAPVLAMALLLQTLDRLARTPSLPPRFLGEQLLSEAAITPQQLAVVLEQQADEYVRGQWRRLGDLIADHGWLDAASLATAVNALRS
ncbi:MAG: hypothetical protein AB4911_23415 [Oscillochloridaceae bacterium umkhey_bin13]